MQVLLYYKYVAIPDVTATVEEQREMCKSQNLRGRVKIAPEGINGSVGGSADGCAAYVAAMEAHPLFGGIDWKSSTSEQEPFPDLIVKEDSEIVASGRMKKVDVASGGTHLSPEDFHAAVAARDPATTALIDVRNGYEVNIGHFEGASDPQTKIFGAFADWVDSNMEAGVCLASKEKVLMYCTGGIRCEKASAYLRSVGVEGEVAQLDGGIHKYLDTYGDGESLFHGRNFVFDTRGSLGPSQALAEGSGNAAAADGAGSCQQVEATSAAVVAEGSKGHSASASSVVGRCEECSAPWERADSLCSVCGDIVVACPACAGPDGKWRGEAYCRDHVSLAGFYCSNLSAYDVDGLRRQRDALEAMLASLVRQRKRRRTIHKQMEVLDQAIASRLAAGESSESSALQAKVEGAVLAEGYCQHCRSRNCRSMCMPVSS
jgi:predicted sulfurtransferase